MKTLVSLITLLAATWLLVACAMPAPKDIVVPDAAPIIAGLNANEATVMGEVADVRKAIDSAVTASEGLASEPAVKAAAAEVETSIKNIEDAIAAHPAADVVKLVEEFKRTIKLLLAVIKDRDAEILRLKDADAVFWNRVLVGLGIACTLGSVASGFFSASIPFVGPYLGPRIGILLGVSAATCFLLAYLFKWTRDHPVHTAVIVVGLLAGAAGLAWANKLRHHEKTA